MGSVMPPDVHERLQSVITECVHWLQKDEETPAMLAWVSVNDRDGAYLIDALGMWQEEAPGRHTTRDILLAA
jgi:hypothetical protein